MDLDTIKWLVIGGISIGIALWYQRKFARRIHYVPTLWDTTPLRAVAEVEDGDIVKLAGRVRAVPGQEKLVSPLSQRPCIAFRYCEMWSYGPHKHTLFHQDHQSVPFLLEGPTGTAWVDPEDVEVRAVFDREGAGKGPRTDAYYAEWADGAPTPERALEFKRVEGIVEDGVEVVVLGRVIRRPDALGELPTGVLERPEIVIEAPDDEDLFLCADRDWVQQHLRPEHVESNM